MRPRALLAVVALLALALAGAGGVKAACYEDGSCDPELGASIQSRVYLDQGNSLQVRSRSTVLAQFTFEAAGGWIVTPPDLILRPGEDALVSVTGQGDDGAEISIHVGAVAPPPEGVGRTELALTSRVFFQTPLDPLPWILGGFGLLVALGTAYASVRWLRSNVQVQIGRRP